MINQIGRIALENFKEIEVTRKEEIDGKVEEKQEKATIRLDLIVPMACPYDLINEALDEFKAEIMDLQKASKERAQKEQAEKELKEKEQIKKE